MKLGELEGSLVHAFFLCVIYFSTVTNMRKLLLNKLGREWSELFKSNNQCLLVSWERRGLELVSNIEIDLARAENNLGNMLTLSKGIGINWLERGALGKLFQRRDSLGVL